MTRRSAHVRYWCGYCRPNYTVPVNNNRTYFFSNIFHWRLNPQIQRANCMYGRHLYMNHVYTKLTLHLLNHSPIPLLSHKSILFPLLCAFQSKLCTAIHFTPTHFNIRIIDKSLIFVRKFSFEGKIAQSEMHTLVLRFNEFEKCIHLCNPKPYQNAKHYHSESFLVPLSS